MNKSNLAKLNEEKESLRLCQSDFAFFQRLSVISIPLIRNHFPEHIQSWGNQAKQRHSLKKINDELTSAFLNLWQHAVKKNTEDLKRKLVGILQRIRGPKFEFGSSLLRHVFYDLQDLYITHLALPQKFPFATLAIKIMDFEKKRRENISISCRHRDLDFGEVCDVCLANCHPLYQIGRSWMAVGWRKMPQEIKWFASKKPIYKKFKLEKFISKALPKKRLCSENAIKRFTAFRYNLELILLREAFAPTAQMELRISMKEYTANTECFADVMWSELMALENCWKLKDEKLLRKRWPRLRGKAYEIGLKGHAAYNDFLMLWQAKDFKTLDTSRHVNAFLCRKKFQRIVDNIHTSISMSDLISSEAQGNGSKKTNSKVSSPDEKTFCDWYNEWKSLHRHHSAHLRTKEKAIKAFKASNVKLSEIYKDSTYKIWIGKLNKRKKAKPKQADSS